MLVKIIEVCLIPFLGILTKYFIDFLNAKRLELNTKTNNELAKKYTNMAIETVKTCVIATNQTYVENLKKTGTFDEAAQKQAFRMTLDAVLAILSDEAKEYVDEITGDINIYLTQLIEKEVHTNKGA